MILFEFFLNLFTGSINLKQQIPVESVMLVPTDSEHEACKSMDAMQGENTASYEMHRLWQMAQGPFDAIFEHEDFSSEPDFEKDFYVFEARP